VGERPNSFVSLLAAIVVAVTGLIPVIWFLTSPAEEPVVTGEGVATTATTSPEVTTVVVEPMPVLEVDELDPTVVRVLQANGYAELAGESDVAELPDAVTRLLIDRGAVLTVVEPNPEGE
jgi:hypothetical protein